MKKTGMSKEHAQAMLALLALESKANSGDESAIESIAEIGVMSCVALSILKHTQAALVDSVAARMDEWPVDVPAIQEMRDGLIDRRTPSTLGTSGEIRTTPNGRKSRKILSGQTGMTLAAYNEITSAIKRRKLDLLIHETGGDPINATQKEPWMESAWKLARLSSTTIDTWSTVGWQLIRHRIKAKDYTESLIPEKFLKAVEARQKRDTVSFEAALRSESVAWLKAGFKQLVADL